MLSIACRLGSHSNITTALNRYSFYSIPFSQFTYNTLLNRYASEGNTSAAFHVLELMASEERKGVTVSDITALNTLLKLFIRTNNHNAALKVLLSFFLISLSFFLFLPFYSLLITLVCVLLGARVYESKLHSNGLNHQSNATSSSLSCKQYRNCTPNPSR